MVEQGVFVAKLAKALQMLCHGYLEYNSTIEIIGHINLRIDNQKYDYIVNEQVSRQGGESTFFQSNSYHSLPPGKCCQTADRQHASRFEDDVSINSHQRVNDSLASMGGNCIKVDLSGPVPYTHGTHLMQPCLSQEACYSSASSGGGTNRRRSHSRDSRLRSVEEDQASAAAHMQDHKFNHSNSSSKDREIEMNGNGDSSRTDAANVMAMYKDMERLRQQRQDMSVKAEPGERTDSEMDDPIAGVDSLMRDNDVMETTTVSILPTAHQAALAAHTGHALMSTNAMAHHGFFDGSGLAAQDASVVQSSAVQEAILQQILNAQKHAAQLPLPGTTILRSPLSLLSSKIFPDNFLRPITLKTQHQQTWNQPLPLLVPKVSPERTSHSPVMDQRKADKVKTKARIKSQRVKTECLAGRVVDFLDTSLSKTKSDVTTSEVASSSASSIDQTAGRRRNLSKRKMFRCSHCEYASARRFNTERHIRLRHPYYRFKCPQDSCHQILLDEREYLLHMRVHGTGFICPYCGISCVNYDTLVSHQSSCDAASSNNVDSGEQTGVHDIYDAKDQCQPWNHGGDDGKGSFDTGLSLDHRVREERDDSQKKRSGLAVNSECSDSEDSVEVVDDNLPVHFMMKQEVLDPDTGCEVMTEEIVQPQTAAS